MHLFHRDDEIVIKIDPVLPVERAYLRQFDGAVVEFKDDDLVITRTPHNDDSASMLNNTLSIKNGIFEMYLDARKGSHEQLARFNRLLDDIKMLMEVCRNS